MKKNKQKLPYAAICVYALRNTEKYENGERALRKIFAHRPFIVKV